MIQTWAMVSGGVVVNVCIWNGDTAIWQAPAGITMAVIPAGSGAGIGWLWNGATFTPNGTFS